MVAVPSIIRLVRLATVPSKASFERRAGKPRLQAGAVARQQRDEIAGADRAVDALAAPVELSGCGKGTRDRRPGQRQVDVVERLGDVVGRVLVIEHRRPGSGFRRTTPGCRRRASSRARWCRRTASSCCRRCRRGPTWICGRSIMTSAISRTGAATAAAGADWRSARRPAARGRRCRRPSARRRGTRRSLPGTPKRRYGR